VLLVLVCLLVFAFLSSLVVLLVWWSAVGDILGFAGAAGGWVFGVKCLLGDRCQRGTGAYWGTGA
jgi:hypothetical protein